ncbi:MAG: glycosyltransferase family 4 protein [Candidatus Sumerlaeia bacterium]
MRILHIASHFGVYRGGAVQLVRLALAQHERGHSVDVIVNVNRKAGASQRASDRATWRLLDEAGLRVRSWAYESFTGRWRLRRAILKDGYDVVHAHRNPALVAAWRALRRMPRPVLVAQRGSISRLPEAALRAFCSPRVGAVAAVAQAVKDALIADGVPGDKIHVVYGSVDLQQFAPRPPDAQRRARLGIPEDAPVIGSLSAWRHGKGLEDLIEALGRTLTTHPQVHAVLLGKDVPARLSRRTTALPPQVAARVHLLDHQQDVAAWLSLMTVTVVAATGREGLSGVLRESLAMGIPVVSTDCAGNNEIVRDGETGRLVPAGDPEALAEALEWALSHPAEMQAMARRGREWVLVHGSSARQAEAMERLYNLVLQR